MPVVMKAVAICWLLRSREIRSVSICSISLSSYRMTSVHRPGTIFNPAPMPRFTNGMQGVAYRLQLTISYD